MEEKIRKYAWFLLKGCLRLNRGDKLFIVACDFIQDFVDIVREEANKLGIFDIQYLISNSKEQKKLYLTKSYEEIIKSPFMDKTKYNEMAKNGYAFLMLSSTLSGYFDEVDSELQSRVIQYQMKSISEYKHYQHKGLIKWNISCVPNRLWSKDLFQTEDLTKFWNVLFDICLIHEEDPIDAWNQKMKELQSRADYLNSLSIKKLVYKNSLGTDITIGLPTGYLFQSADGQNIVNMPTEEVFTSPSRLEVNGRVVASKPLIHNNKVIQDFWFQFQDGKVIDYDAKVGKEVLRGILDTDLGAQYLGEVALVDFDSPISKSNLIFKHTLYDENASCHLALGASFAECIVDGLTKSNEELLNMGLNYSHEHVDFFIGTRDLNIKAILQNGEEKVIMDNGNFTLGGKL